MCRSAPPNTSRKFVKNASACVTGIIFPQTPRFYLSHIPLYHTRKKKRRFSLENTSLHITFCISIKFYTYPKINSIKSKIFLTVNNILYSYIFMVRVWGGRWRSGIIRFHDALTLCPHTRVILSRLMDSSPR